MNGRRGGRRGRGRGRGRGGSRGNADLGRLLGHHTVGDDYEVSSLMLLDDGINSSQKNCF